MGDQAEATVITIRRPRLHNWVIKLRAKDRLGREVNAEATVSAATMGDALDEMPEDLLEEALKDEIRELDISVRKA